MDRVRSRDLHLFQRIRRGLEVPLREVQIHRRVRQVGVPEQQLNRAQVGTGFQQVGGVRVSEGVGCDVFLDPGPTRRELDGLQITLAVMGLSARQLWTVPGNRYVWGRIQRQYSRSVVSKVGLSGTSRISALRFLYVRVLKRRDMKEDLPYPQRPKRLPTVLSHEEVRRLIASAKNLFHRATIDAAFPSFDPQHHTLA